MGLFSGFVKDLTRLPSKSTAITLGAGGAAALAVHPGDARLTRDASRSMPIDLTFDAGDSIGNGWTQGVAALGTWVVGEATGNPRVRSVGADLVQAQMLAGLMTQGLKLAVNRTRPDEGGHSFPSGHSSATFATATVLHRQFGWKVGLPAYGAAAYVAASRLSENQHYASDVIFGAALGIVAGHTTTIGHGAHRFVMAPTVVPGGAALLLSRF